MPSNRRVRYLVYITIAGAILVVALWMWFAQRSSVMNVTVRVTGEDRQVEVERVTVPFRAGRHERPVASITMDLARWEGTLVRLDIEGGLGVSRRGDGSAAFVGCAASVTSGAHERRLEFVGWDNPSRERLHIGTVGPVSFRGPERRGHTFVYGRENRLWHVISVRPREQLTLYFTPILAADLDRLDEPYVPPGLAPWSLPSQHSEPRAGRAPDVFIYLIDALRPDHLGCHGYGRPTSPAIDQFAEGAVVYEQAQTASTWTRPSVASLLTGLYPLAHGVMHMDADKLDEWPVTMPEALHAGGYQTLHVCTNGHASGHYGFLQGVRAYAYKNDQSPEWANSQVAALLEGEPPDQPVFAYVHTLGPHDPYAPKADTFRLFDRGFPGASDGSATTSAPQPPPPAREIQRLIDLYDAEVRECDAAFAEFLALLKRTGRFENSVIIMLADHGEAFAEHGMLRHGTTLSAEEMRVPLIIRYPQGEHGGTRVATRVSLVDVYPTVMAASGVSEPLSYALPGRDLAELAASSSTSPEVPVFAEVSQHSDNPCDLVGVIDESGYKRVLDLSAEPGGLASESSIGLWDTRSDPTEQVDLSRSLPLRAAYGEVLLGRYLVTQRWWRGPASTGTAASAPLTPEMEKSLKALGYVE